MTSNFFISIGGTGAKVCEALTHLCAAGYMEYGVDSWLQCVMVDPDSANGVLQRCLGTMKLYQECKSIVGKTAKTPLFGADLSFNDQPFSPVDPSANNLRDMFKTDLLAEHEDEDKRGEAMLIRSLFSEDEIGQPLGQGFRGHPAIGAVSFGRSVTFTGKIGEDHAKAADAPKQNRWQDFAGKVRERAQNGNVRILFVGSIFGGSGASGMPTLARLIHDELAPELKDRLEIGMILYQPYFDFKDVEPKPGVIAASSKDFALATSEALQYYSDCESFKYCRNIYTLGEQSRAFVPHRGGQPEGGEDQKNDPHYLELIGALAAVEFFRGARGKDHLFLASRSNNTAIGWTDLPQPDMQASEGASSPDRRGETRDSFEAKLKRMTRFAIAYHYYCHPQIFAKPNLRDTWDVYRNSITASRESQALENLGIVNRYCEAYLKWLVSVLRPAGTGFGLDLFQVDQIGHEVGGLSWAPWTPEEYFNARLSERLPRLVIQAEGSPAGPDLTAIYKDASARMRTIDSDSVDAGKVVRVIYDVC